MKQINFEDLQSDKVKVRYSCTKLALEISEKNPKALYADLDVFVKLLDSDNNIFVWTAIMVIGNLSAVDGKKKIDKLIPKLFGLFHSQRMITSANTIAAMAKIAKNKPYLTDEIIKELLQVEKINYQNKGKPSPECRNIAIGHLLDSFKYLGDVALKRPDVGEFVKRQTKNSRPSVSARAIKLAKNSSIISP